MARPASRKQQTSREIRDTGELALKPLTGSFKSTLPTRHPGGNSLAPLHAALTRAQTCTLSGVPGSRKHCFWVGDLDQCTDSPGFHTITRRERELLLVLQLRNLTSNIFCYLPDKQFPRTPPSSFSQFVAKGKQKW